MKSCPTCKRTYPDDTLGFCLEDGSVLSASYEPEQTQRIPPSRPTSPPATEVMRDPSPVGASAPPAQSTIHAPRPAIPALDQKEFITQEPPLAKRRVWPWLMAIIGVLVLGIFVVKIVFVLFTQNSSSPRVLTPQGRSSPVINSLTVEEGIDRPGSDYRDFDLPDANFERCREACANDSQCKAYTFVRPGIQGPSARCWLKTEVPSGGPSSCCISGVKTTSN